MATKIPAYGARATKAPLEPLTIERRKPRPHDVEIEILYCGICHSDVHKVNDDWPAPTFRSYRDVRLSAGSYHAAPTQRASKKAKQNFETLSSQAEALPS